MSDDTHDPDADENEELPESSEAHEAREGGPEGGPIPERPTDKEPHPGKGAGRRSNVQRAPEDQRGNPDPDH